MIKCHRELQRHVKWWVKSHYVVIFVGDELKNMDEET